MNQRPRRNRKSESIRKMVQETNLSVNDFIYPLFIVDRSNIKEEISSMPNVFRWSLNLILKEIESCVNLGINSFVLESPFLPH